MQKILDHFKNHDVILYTAALTLKEPLQRRTSDNYFSSLCESIISQQLSVKVGDVIIFGKYSGQEVKVDNEEYLIMKEDDVYGVLEA